MAGRLPAGASGDHDDARDRGSGRQAAASSPRPRSTPRDVLLRWWGRRRRSRASAASWSPSPRDVPTYDKKPEMSAREAADAFVASAGARTSPRFGIINFANADMVGAHGRHRCGRHRDRDGRRLPRRRRRRRPRPGGGACSSPPTTATPTRCSKRTARPTPRTPEPGASCHHGGQRSAARGRHSCRCRTNPPQPSRDRPAGGDDRTLAPCPATDAQNFCVALDSRRNGQGGSWERADRSQRWRRSPLWACWCASSSRSCWTGMSSMRSNADLARRAERIVLLTSRLHRLTVDLETGVRGRLLTGEDRYLAPYRDARAADPHRRGLGCRARQGPPRSASGWRSCASGSRAIAPAGRQWPPACRWT